MIFKDILSSILQFAQKSFKHKLACFVVKQKFIFRDFSEIKFYFGISANKFQG